MAYYLRKKKVVDECDVGCDLACTAPMTDIPDGIGPVIPGHSGDRFDNILGSGFVNTIPMMPATSKKKYKIRKRKTKR